jgi:hypothetical protein
MKALIATHSHNMKTRHLRVGWYLQPPFNDPFRYNFFHAQNSWRGDPWFCVDEETGTVSRKVVPREAAAYELARRHPQVGLMLLGCKMPGSGAERFLFEYGREG